MTYTLAVIGGSGLYDIEGLTDVHGERVETPYGMPSDIIVCGTLAGTRLLFLPRHGRGHRIAPHAINFRANICALKMLGATHLVTVSAVGSMKEAIVPGHLVVPDQFIDLTKRRVSTFFDEGVVAHVSFADPVCGDLASALADAAGRAGGTVHRGGTYVCIEGPAFSTRAESFLYRSWGVSVIGMTAMPEARLAREAELPYAVLALATDYDAWHESEAAVDVAVVVATIQKNVALAKGAIVQLASALPDPTKSRAVGAARNGLMSAVTVTETGTGTAADAAARKTLDWLLGPAGSG
jgi:5'-methylthioadenosine phosphorylase